MEKRGKYAGNSEWVEDEVEELEVAELPEPLETEPTTVKLVLLMETNLTILGPVTKKLYHVDGAGSIVEVDEADANPLLSKTSGPSCCGGKSTAWFELAK